MPDPQWFSDVIRSFDASLVDSMREVAPASQPVGEGCMGIGRPGSWMNQTVGLGQIEPVTTEQIQAVIDFYQGHGIEPRVEVPSRVHPSIYQELASAGFRVREMEEVALFDLRQPLAKPMGDVTMRSVDVHDDRALSDALTIERRAKAGDDSAEMPAEERADWFHILRLPMQRVFLAEIDGESAGFCGLSITPPPAGAPKFALMFAGCTRAKFRRRGVQQAMMLHRLRIAADEGCEVVGVAGAPGGSTIRNAMRLNGFLLCTMTTFVRSGEGLMPSP